MKIGLCANWRVVFGYCLLSVLLNLLPTTVTALEAPIVNGKGQMSGSGQQSLSLMNYLTGHTYTWLIESGGGTLSSDTGERVEYTAPDSNPNGENNPTISVTDADGNSEELQIAVNSYPYSEHPAYSDWIDEGCDSWGGLGQGGCTACIHKNTYNCDGDLLGEAGGACSQCFPPNGCSCCYNKVDWWTGGKTVQQILNEPPQDLRWEFQKEQGCSPEALLPEYEPEATVPQDISSGIDPSAICPAGDQSKVGNPISIYEGNNVETEEDLRFASAARRRFAYERFYNSRSTASGPLGYGWSHTYRLTLTPSHGYNGDIYLKINDESERGVYFEDAGGGHYEGAFKERTTVELEGIDYVWYRLDSRRFAFNPDGRLIWIEDEVGNRLNLTYDADNRLQTVADTASGLVLTFHYNGEDRVDYISGPVTPSVADGIWVRYEYDASGNLTSVLYPDGSGFDYEYADPNDANNLTAKQDKSGHLLSSWTYDNQDRATGNFTRDGRGVTIDYVDENKVEVTDAYGITRTYEIWTLDGRKKITDVHGPEGCQACGDEVVRIEYDSMARVIEVEFAGGLIEQYGNFDSRGNAQTIIVAVAAADEKTVTRTFHPDIDAKLSETEPSLIGAGDRVVIWDYDDDGNDTPNENPARLLHRKIEKGFTGDASGNVAPYEYITAYTYNGKGQVLSIDGPRPGSQDVTTFTYDGATGNLLTKTSPLIGTTTYSQYDAAGQPGRVTDPNGNAVTYTYDGRGRILTRTNEADGSATIYTYNTAGEPSHVARANGVFSDFTYDDTYGRLTKVADPLDNYIAYGYDDQGNRTETGFYDASDQRHFWKRFDYHGPTQPGKLYKEINPDDTYTEYTYDAAGNIASVKDAAAKTTAYDYDLFNRLTGVTQPGDVVTGYAYDSRDNLISVTDAENHATTYVYDDLGRLVSATSPDTGTTTYAYDAAGNLISKTDANGAAVTYTYDDLNRLTGIHFPEASQDITYTYDTGTNGKGRLSNMTDPGGTHAYTYDALGNLVSEEKTAEGITCLTQYDYDEAGILTEITYPNGRVVAYELDGAGRVIRVTSTKDSVTDVLAENIGYLPFGPIQGFTYGNGAAVNHSFDLLYRLTGKSAGSVQDLSYAFDPVGNITAITDNLDPVKNQIFGYDDLYRLTGATGVYGQTGYTYDKVGNRLTKTIGGQTDTYTYTAGTNRLAQITGATNKSFSYDANGNTTAAGAASLTYNRNNRLIQAAENSEVLGEYVYNGNGQRIKKTAEEKTFVYHYDLFGNLIGESTPAGDSVAEYIYLGSTRLAAFIAEVPREITVSVSASMSGALLNVPVYAFTEDGAYTGKSAVTDADGIAHFVLSDFSDGVYKFRADYLTSQFWSDVITLPGEYGAAIDISEETATVRVIQGGSLKEGLKVYLFNGAGAYLGIYATTDQNGEVFFDLPAGMDFKFRADNLGSQFYSDVVTIVLGGPNIYDIDTGGGSLTVTLDKGEGTPISGTPVYLFNDQGLYLGLSDQTDALGQVVFEVPSGTYNVRADYTGYQFWSLSLEVAGDDSLLLSIPHQDVTITVQGDYDSDIQAKENINVYLFTEAGAYLGQSATTNAQGQAVFNVPEKGYKVRADHLTRQYWSEPFIWQDKSIVIEEGAADVTMIHMGLPVEGVNVYVFTSAGSYLGIYDVTDQNGQVSFRLPSGDYNFRGDYMANYFWSGESTLIPHVVNPVTISAGGGAFTLEVLKGVDDPLEAVDTYLFTDTGTYLGEHEITSSEGEVTYYLADGSYKIRIDYMGYQFWTDPFTVPDTLSETYTIAHQDVTVTVQGDNNGDIDPKESVSVYLFTASGSYLGQFQTTDLQGQVSFNLPEMDYKVRADYLNAQYWSGVLNWTEETITINEGIAEVHVVSGANPVENVPVYVFTSLGTYLNISGQTDEYGVVGFRLPEATHKFRADHLSEQYWATEPVNAHQVNVVNIDTGGGAFVLTVEKSPGVPITNIPVYAFTSGGTYLGLSGHTDTQGEVSFDLTDGDYKFRADYLGYQFWSGISTVPNTLSDVLTIAHQDVTITAESLYQTSEPLQGVRVYLFTGSGAYMGKYGDTNVQGQVTFNLPEQSYKVRADYTGYQFWSDAFVWTDTAVTIDHGLAVVHVTKDGLDVADAPVYLFTSSGSYLGIYDYTDVNGVAEFLLPDQQYKFRVDHEGTQYWSEVITVIPHQQNNIELNLDLLALDLTNDPKPVRYDGEPPEPEGVLVASIGSLTGILAQSVITQTPDKKVYYYVNDHLGTPVKVIDENGAVVWSSNYKPFGEVDITVSDVENNFRFAGQYYDQETELHYNYHRYYAPTAGRYLRADPIGYEKTDIMLYFDFHRHISNRDLFYEVNSFLQNPQRLNNYSYCLNNPIFYVDPYGLEEKCREDDDCSKHKFNKSGYKICTCEGEYSLWCKDGNLKCVKNGKWVYGRFCDEKGILYSRKNWKNPNCCER